MTQPNQQAIGDEQLVQFCRELIDIYKEGGKTVIVATALLSKLQQPPQGGVGYPAPDCGDNSCMFGGQGKGGMRTNGGCRCLQGLPVKTRLYFQRLHQLVAPKQEQTECQAHSKSEYKRLKALGKDVIPPGEG